MERKETRKGFVRITLDLPTPLYERLDRYVAGLRALYGASEQAICRRFVEEGLNRAEAEAAGPKPRKGQ